LAFKKLKYWFDGELAALLAEKISSNDPSFDTQGFIDTIDTGVQNLELKDRVELIADTLHRELSRDIEKNIRLLTNILGPENKEETGMFTNYYWIMPIAKYVEKYGLNHFETSIKAIEEITKRNTGEYAIRPFVLHFQDKTLNKLLAWAHHENKHVRRLASEGIRPRLPWATKLQPFIDDPQPIIPILHTLKDDPSKYVQKSVANCLNDILKDNFKIGSALVEEWSAGNPGKELKWVLKHAIRNFTKQENKWALMIATKLK